MSELGQSVFRNISVKLALMLLALAALSSGQRVDQKKTDDQIKKEIIAESIAHYHGSCPCPYNIDRAGRSCGRRSAYSRPGGASPICYDKDVTQQMMDEYRKTHQ